MLPIHDCSIHTESLSGLSHEAALLTLDTEAAESFPLNHWTPKGQPREASKEREIEWPKIVGAGQACTYRGLPNRALDSTLSHDAKLVGVCSHHEQQLLTFDW